MDYIHLEQMQFYGYHGALREENVIGQRFQVTVSIATSLEQAGTNDALEQTINYAEVYAICENIVEGEPVQLIETLAERIAKEVLRTFPKRALGVKVKVMKPDPPIRGHYRHVAVEIVRGQYV